MRSTARLILRLPLYWSFRTLGRPTLLPFNYTISITYRCNSRCKTCKIWQIQHKIPREMELTTEEWVATLKSLRTSAYWITISGGEPYLREDLVDIAKAIDEYNKPRLINIPTNGILWKIIPKKTKEILENISDKTKLVINFSLDGIGKDHDEIRGIVNNYEFFKKSYKETIMLKERYCNLIVGIHTVTSSWNVCKVPKIYEVVMKEFSPDQYITEIAEERKEMENLGEGITPSPEEYTQVLNYLIANIERELKQNKWRGLAKVTEAFRIEYYKLMKNFYLTKKQRMPSYAGFASAQISPTGDVWECAVYATFMGNLRNYDFDFKRLWHSNQAWEVRRRVKKEHKCPLANESYINLLFSPMHLIKVATRII